MRPSNLMWRKYLSGFILCIILLILSYTGMTGYQSIETLSREIVSNKAQKIDLNETRAFLNEINELNILKSDRKNEFKINVFEILIGFENDLNEIVYIKVDEINNKLYYFNAIAQRLGNVIETYWVARSIAFWLSLQFEIVSVDDFCKYNNCVFMEKIDITFLYSISGPSYAKYRHRQYFFDENYWTSYLPKKTNISILDYYLMDGNKYITILKSIKNIIQYQNYCDKYCDIDRGNRFGIAVYSSLLKNVYYNEIFLSLIIRKEINKSLDLIMKNDNINFLSLIKFCNSCNDVAIHFRCGDVFGRDFGDSSRGYYSINYYIYIFDKILSWNIYKNTTIYIIGQCGTKLKQWQCHEIAVTMKQELQNYLNIKIVLICDNNLNNDFYNLINAPLLISSSSTFSWIATLGRNKTTIIPQQSPWGDWLIWYKPYIPKYVTFFDFFKNNQTQKLYLTNMKHPSDLDAIINFIKPN